MYTYKMIQIPPNIAVAEKNNHNQIAAVYLQNIVNKYAEDGWEFQRIDSIGVIEKPGCWSFGKKEKSGACT